MKNQNTVDRRQNEESEEWNDAVEVVQIAIAKKPVVGGQDGMLGELEKSRQ